MFRTSCPIVKREIQTFSQSVNVGGESKRIEFEKEIVWIQESESQLLYKHGEKVIKEGSTDSDYYGYLTSPTIDRPTPAEQAKYYSITTESSLELVVMTTVLMRPAIENSEDAAVNKNNTLNNYKVQLSEVPSNWMKADCSNLESITLAAEVTWSSKNTAQQNSELLAEFIKRWTL